MPTPLGISMAVLLLLSAAQNFAMIRAGATRGRRWFLTILMVLFVPILPMFAGCVDQIRDPRSLRDDRHRKDDDFPDF